MFMNKHKDEKDEVNRPLRLVSFPKQELSRTVDLRQWMSPIESQGDMNTCCAIAFAGICEYLIKRYSGRSIDVSRLFIYYNGQIISQRTHRVADLGVEQRNIVLGLRKYGICQENVWPYRENLLNVEPSSDAYRKASRYTVVPLRIPFNIKAIETCLHNQIPVLIDVILVNQTGTFIKANHGYLTLPNLNNSIIDRTSLHTVVLVGYDQNTKHFTVRNSWGGNWGYQGYFFMPYKYLSDERLVNPYDGLWTITQIIPRTNKLPDICQLGLPNHHKNNRHQRH